MLPEITRTGRINIKEQGFTSHFSVDGDSHSFSVRYYDGQWKPFPDHMKRQLAELVSSVWVAAIPAEKKVFTHRLDKADIDLLEFISYQTQAHYRRSMKYPGLASNPEMYVTRGDNDWSDMDLDLEGCGLYFSGGRDAFCSLGMLEDAGYDPHLIQVNNGSSWDAAEKARDHFMNELDRHIDTAWNNFGLLKREITKGHGVYWHLEAPIFHMTFLMSMPMLEKGLMFFGNEATTTRFCSVGKDRILNSSWEQSLVATNSMMQWAQRKEIDLRVGSVLREMGDYRIMKELYERHPDYYDKSVSCFFVDKDNEYSPCSKCHKCYRNYLCLKAIGGDVSKYDEERLQEYEIDPANLMWKTILPNDFSHINHFAEEYTEAPTQWRKEIEGLMFREGRGDPSNYLTEGEFFKIYEAILDDDTPYLYRDDGWESTTLEEAWDEMQSWDVDNVFDYSVRVKNNNSLLNV